MNLELEPMADLAKKKWLRAGHRESTMRMLNKLLKADKVDLVKLAQLKLSLQEKLDALEQFDSEVWRGSFIQRMMG